MSCLHNEGRLHYTMGDIREAVNFFLSLLHGSHDRDISRGAQTLNTGEEDEVTRDKGVLDDFRVAFQVRGLSS